VPYLPAVPTLAEAGIKDFETAPWQGLLAPAGTPQPIIERLNAALTASAQTDQIRARLHKLGFEPLTSTPQQAAHFLATETERWAKVVAASGARIE
jgi:tripartite-type tricarboxylate transporter receptor subunit TctC